MAGRDEEEFLVWAGPRPFDPATMDEAPTGDEVAPAATIVQFRAGLTEPDIARLRGEYGLALDRFVPELAYLERLAPDTLARVRDDFLVRATAPLTAEQKLGPSIPADAPAELSATLFDDADPAELEPLLDGAQARDVRVLDDRPIAGALRVVFVLDDLAGVAQIAASPDVLAIDGVDTPNPLSTPDAAMTQSGSPTKPTIWDHGLHGEGQVIGVIDEGPVDLAHCFFAGAGPNTPGPGHRKVIEQRNAKDPNGAPVPANDHATSVAGIAAGDERGNEGKHPDRGGAFAARLVCGTFAGLVANGLLAELDKSRTAGAVIHSNSYNQGKTPRGEYTDWAQEVDAFTHADEHQLVVAGTGNSFDPDPSGQLIPGNLSPPGIAKNAVCVGAAKAAPDHMAVGRRGLRANQGGAYQARPDGGRLRHPLGGQGPTLWNEPLPVRDQHGGAQRVGGSGADTPVLPRRLVSERGEARGGHGHAHRRPAEGGPTQLDRRHDRPAGLPVRLRGLGPDLSR